MKIRFTFNGRPVEADISPRITLADYIRDHLGATGTHVGCEHGVCGACTILVDGAAVRSCLMLAVQAEGSTVTTVEGLSPPEGLSPLQAAFRRNHALQCGYCTPGMLTTAHALLTQEPDATRERITEVMSGNLCRCTGYINIIDAVCDARASYAGTTDSSPPSR
jgi:aerobic-type carbon monoxide dehydrogenase small subunit (CoxS/CutS family)